MPQFLLLPNYFSCSNAFIVPVAYFLYPETANRSLEEMDIIFRKSKSIFDTVGIAINEPRRYSKHVELLIKAEDMGDERMRNASVVSGTAGKEKKELQSYSPNAEKML